MILTGREIAREVGQGKIHISPFVSAQITTNSYDVLLGTEMIRYTSRVLDPKVKPTYKRVPLPPGGYQMKRGEFLLASTHEEIGSDSYVPILHGKSGVARMGLFVHLTADLIDIGSHGNLTLQMYATAPVKIYPNMPIAQVSFWKPHGKIVLYRGKYQHSKGPQPSLLYQYFKKREKKKSSARKK